MSETQTSSDSNGNGNGNGQSQQPSTRVQEMLIKHKAAKAALMEEEDKMRFSYDLEATFTEDERKADAKLKALYKELVTPYNNVVIRDFFDNKSRVENSKLFEVLNKMPKGAIHHIHTSAAMPVETYIKLTYEDIVYYNEREGLFKVFPQGGKMDGYLQCTEMRKFSESPEKYDQHLKEEILLLAEQSRGLESHQIWEHFQPKFSRVTDLGKYFKFFRILLEETLRSCIRQNVFIVELRHISGMLYDEERKSLSFEFELNLIEEVLAEVKKDHPHFELMLVITGLKLVGHPHVAKMLDHVKRGMMKSKIVAGFDMVNEEEFTQPISDFMPEILAAQKSEETLNMPCFFHAGETHDKNILNLHDAVLLNTKRIGHGFQLALFPNLVEEIKKRNICIESCPLSNMVLGYTKDLRSHPVRAMLDNNVQVTISSDDPCFFEYEGVTLDYVYATLAWDLDLRDLKKLSMNGITYASVDDKKKDFLHKEIFPGKWDQFIKYINNLDISVE